MTEFTEVRLGNSDLVVSRFGYGTYHLLDAFNDDFDAAVDSVQAAWDSGIDFIDTSDNYPGSEEVIGTALQRGLPREYVVIATKTGLATSREEAKAWQAEQKRVDCSPTRIEAQLGKSLITMGVDEVDLYQLHMYDPNIPHTEVAGKMSELISAGKIRAWGVSNYSAAKLLNRR